MVLRLPQQLQPWAVACLLAVFGISSWVTLNGMFAELPFMVDSLPEGWAIGATLSVAVSCANVGPIVCLVLAKYGKLPVDAAIVVVLCTCLVACLCLANFWSDTVALGGKQQSLPLLLLGFMSALADCTTSVLFFPFAARFGDRFISFLLIGEGLGGVVAGFLALIQADFYVSTATVFSPDVYFYLLTLTIAASLAAFAVLRKPSHTAKQRQPLLSHTFDERDVATGQGNSSRQRDRHQQSEEQQTLLADDISSSAADSRSNLSAWAVPAGHEAAEYGPEKPGAVLELDTDVDGPEQEAGSLVQVNGANGETLQITLHTAEVTVTTELPRGWWRQLSVPLLCLAWLSFCQNGVAPAMVSYATAPYSNTTYRVASALALLIDPMAVGIAEMFRQRSSQRSQARLVHMLIAAMTVFYAYITYLAACSPEPPLPNSDGARALAAAVVIIGAGTTAASKALVAVDVKRRTPPKYVQAGMLWLGVVMQAASAFGAVLFFFLVNNAHLFHQT